MEQAVHIFVHLHFVVKIFQVMQVQRNVLMREWTLEENIVHGFDFVLSGGTSSVRRIGQRHRRRRLVVGFVRHFKINCPVELALLCELNWSPSCERTHGVPKRSLITCRVTRHAGIGRSMMCLLVFNCRGNSKSGIGILNFTHSKQVPALFKVPLSKHGLHFSAFIYHQHTRYNLYRI